MEVVRFLSGFRKVDEEVLKKASAGDLSAFEALYRALSGFVYRTAFRIVQNGADADEVTQDVFLKVYDHLTGFKSQALFSTWVYRITVNTALNYAARGNRERSRRSDLEAVLEQQSVPQAALDQLGQKDAAERLEKILESLAPEQRECLVIREIEGLDYREIAQVLDINLNTVRTRLKRARDALLELARKGVVQREL